jgi:hypothetical protein
MASLLTATSSRADDNKESLIKAAFVYNFVKFVQWPGALAIGGLTHIDICVLGNSSMSQTGAVFRQASTPKLSLNLTSESSAGAASGHCHIVFISSSEAARLDEILAQLKTKPVLTVSDISGFADRGGMIGFTTEDNKVKLEVNPKAAAAAGLHIDAQLLEIARHVVGQ